MRPSRIVFRSVRVATPKPAAELYQIPPLSSISVQDLPNNGFGEKNYYIAKTKFGYWPVYKKVQNTKITTEIKRIKGDLDQFKSDLLKQLPHIQAKNVVVNKHAGYVNVKGDVVEEINEVFNSQIGA